MYSSAAPLLHRHDRHQQRLRVLQAALRLPASAARATADQWGIDRLAGFRFVIAAGRMLARSRCIILYHLLRPADSTERSLRAYSVAEDRELTRSSVLSGADSCGSRSWRRCQGTCSGVGCCFLPKYITPSLCCVPEVGVCLRVRTNAAAQVEK